ncbi:hypothetical protein PRIPAC_85834 [Pristionchus pacificus]|uniref:Apple domain-containing protein n=1 Tax=Pristionchus pacificus TaxID=54126 RepID=H3E5X0_PRIPA|nr:hypothetical protein PRIPAC_84257 [Pristionchus pacificus]KAF8368005.1 hypothetical protein PRIPAC_85834 [Pristionchus pacificus]|eukprot:PDM70870.1 hypothetical protein PRIPAC_49068 [Pristionchus pacificus]
MFDSQYHSLCYLCIDITILQVATEPFSAIEHGAVSGFIREERLETELDCKLLCRWDDSCNTYRYDNNTGRCKIYESYDFAEGRLIFGRKIRPRVRSGLKLRLAERVTTKTTGTGTTDAHELANNIKRLFEQVGDPRGVFVVCDEDENKGDSSPHPELPYSLPYSTQSTGSSDSFHPSSSPSSLATDYGKQSSVPSKSLPPSASTSVSSSESPADTKTSPYTTIGGGKPSGEELTVTGEESNVRVTTSSFEEKTQGGQSVTATPGIISTTVGMTIEPTTGVSSTIEKIKGGDSVTKTTAQVQKTSISGMDETDKGALSTENTLQTTKRKTTIKDSIGVDQDTTSIGERTISPSVHSSSITGSTGTSRVTTVSPSESTRLPSTTMLSSSVKPSSTSTISTSTVSTSILGSTTKTETVSGPQSTMSSTLGDDKKGTLETTPSFDAANCTVFINGSIYYMMDGYQMELVNYTQKKNDYSDAVEPMMVAGKDSEANVTFSYYLMNECRLVLQKGDNSMEEFNSINEEVNISLTHAASMSCTCDPILSTPLRTTPHPEVYDETTSPKKEVTDSTTELTSPSPALTSSTPEVELSTTPMESTTSLSSPSTLYSSTTPESVVLVGYVTVSGIRYDVRIGDSFDQDYKEMWAIFRNSSNLDVHVTVYQGCQMIMAMIAPNGALGKYTTYTYSPTSTKVVMGKLSGFGAIIGSC